MLIGHKKQWEFLKKNIELGQLSHAYIFTGANEIGKRTFALELIKLINCLSSDERPCQKCANCQMIEKNSFADLMIVNSGVNKEIEISKIREVQNFLSYKSYYGSFKAVIVDDAEKMNQEAQSCFLKTLEEPKGKTLLIIISSKPDMLLPTISSRCQVVKFYRPKGLPMNDVRAEKEKMILTGLAGVFNSGLADKFKYAKEVDFEQNSLLDILEIIQKYFRQQLFLETGIGNLSDQESLLQTSKKYPVKKIKNILGLTEEIYNKAIFTNINPKLALEILLMEI